MLRKQKNLMFGWMSVIRQCCCSQCKHSSVTTMSKEKVKKKHGWHEINGSWQLRANFSGPLALASIPARRTTQRLPPSKSYSLRLTDYCDYTLTNPTKRPNWIVKQASMLLCTAAAAEGSSKRRPIWAEFSFNRNRKHLKARWQRVCLQRGCCNVISFTKTRFLTYCNQLAERLRKEGTDKEQIITATTGR